MAQVILSAMFPILLNALASVSTKSGYVASKRLLSKITFVGPGKRLGTWRCMNKLSV